MTPPGGPWVIGEWRALAAVIASTHPARTCWCTNERPACYVGGTLEPAETFSAYTAVKPRTQWTSASLKALQQLI